MIESAHVIQSRKTRSFVVLACPQMLNTNIADSIHLSHGLQPKKAVVYSPFLLAAFGAIATVIMCRRQFSNLRDGEIQSQAFFVGGASEAPEPRLCCRQFSICQTVTALSGMA